LSEEGPDVAARWTRVLGEGGSRKPLELMKMAGVDLEDPGTIRSAVAYVGRLIDEVCVGVD